VTKVEKDEDSDVLGRIKYEKKVQKSIMPGHLRESEMLKKKLEQQIDLNRDTCASQPSLRL
jgi:hypothetical protein